MLKKIILTTVLTSTFFLGIAQTQARKLTNRDTMHDPSLQIPEEMERNFDQLLVDWKGAFKQSTHCKKTVDGDVYYPDSVYINRLYSLPSEMELIYNPIVRSYIDMYSARRKSSVEYMLGKSAYYFPMIEQALDKYGLPLELKYLSIIESALNPVAVSRVGATGLWQFMLGTGKMYDLEVNSLVDERRDPAKSTEAAARYLKDLYNIYGDWNLVIAAYNCGPGNVNKAIRRSGGEKDYWTIYPYLPKETRGYVPAFIAATYIMNYYPKHNICPLDYDYPKSMDTLLIDKTVHLQQISEMLDISIDKLRTLNPQYKKDIIPGDFKSYVLCLPSSSAAHFVTISDTIYAHKANEFLTHRKTVDMGTSDLAQTSSKQIHRVKKGESLAAIANKYGVSAAQIKKWNNLRSNRVAAGKRLAIYKETPATRKKSIADSSKPESKILANEQSSEGANLDSVSSDFFANYYKSKNPIRSGESSVNSKHTSEAGGASGIDESSRTIYHKIRIGETIPLIASKYNVTTNEIVKWNNLSNKKLKVGQRLAIHLPKKQSALYASAKESTESVVNTKPQVSSERPKSTAVAAKKKPNKTTYRVKKGDSLYIIAKRFNNVTPKDIRLANNLSNDKLSIGQTLNIPIN